MSDKDLKEEKKDTAQEIEIETDEPDKDTGAEETVNDTDTDAGSNDGSSDEGDKEEAVNEDEGADGEASSEEGEEGAPGDKKKFFKKKDKKDKRDEQIEQLTDRVKRQMAEFENFRKRTEKEKASMYEMGARSVIEKILPVIDNFERGLDTVPEEEKDAPFTEGMRMIYKQMMTELENIGVKPIEALGTAFNPDFHNAVMQVASEEYESGHVAQELQKGYMYRDSVVRHSMVAVVE